MHIDKHLKDTSELKRVQEILNKELGESIIETTMAFRELTVLARKKDIIRVLRFLRNDRRLLFKSLIDITAVDWLGKDDENRFRVVYHLLSLHKNLRIRVKVKTGEKDAVPSICDLFAASNWFEREVYDMFGIHFEGHPDLRRILTDYTFEGFPLRKDFPLNGNVEVYYDSDEKRVKYKPVDLPQELRRFDKVSPWGGVNENAHLAEKPNLFDEEDFK